MKYLIWDFDGTLGYRAGRAWSVALIETLDRCLPGHSFVAEQLAPHLRAGFPWHSPERPHEHITTADQWWAALAPTLEAAFSALGLPAEQTRWLAGQVRPVYADPTRFCLFDDTLDTLDALSARGWTHVILSNHVPEFDEIAAALGLTQRMAAVFNSAWLGFEKPHEQIFRKMLAALGAAAPQWMIGDNYQADIVGAASVGIPGILVRRPHEAAARFSPDLRGVIEIVADGRP